MSPTFNDDDNLPYWERVRNRAAELGTDGCTGGIGAYEDCCMEHDIACRTGATVDGVPQTKQQAAERLRSCIQARSKLGWWSPVAWWRYAAVKWFGPTPPPVVHS